LNVSGERINQEFPPEIKARRRAERYGQGETHGGMVEVDHIVPKYAGGSCEEENSQGLTLPEHAIKHFVDALDPPPKQNTQAEWVGTRYIIGRMNLDEFTDFLGLVEPMIPELRADLQRRRGRRG
jgi:hypothetical protein